MPIEPAELTSRKEPDYKQNVRDTRWMDSWGRQLRLGNGQHCTSPKYGSPFLHANLESESPIIMTDSPGRRDGTDEEDQDVLIGEEPGARLNFRNIFGDHHHVRKHIIIELMLYITWAK